MVHQQDVQDSVEPLPGPAKQAWACMQCRIEKQFLSGFVRGSALRLGNRQKACAVVLGLFRPYDTLGFGVWYRPHA